MSSSWTNDLASYPSVPSISSSVTIPASDSVAASIHGRTIISSSPTQILPPRFSELMFRPSNSSVENTPSSILKAPRSNRVSFFTSKFRLFKARRTTTSDMFVDPNEEADLAGLQQADAAESRDKGKEDRPHNNVRTHRAMTAPTLMESPPSPPLIGLGLIGLEYDSRGGKYWFRDAPRTPSSGISSVLGRLGSEGSFGSTCPSPKTPSSATVSDPTSKDEAPEKDDDAKLETQVKEMLRYDMDEVDPAAMAGILAVLFPPYSPVDQHKQRQGEQLSQLDGHRLMTSDVGKDSQTVDSSASETEDGMHAFAYLVQSPDKRD